MQVKNLILQNLEASLTSFRLRFRYFEAEENVLSIRFLNLQQIIETSAVRPFQTKNILDDTSRTAQTCK